MARSSLRDPLDRFRFIVTVDGFTRTGFMTCSSPSYTINAKEYAEGGSHLQPRKIIDSITYKPVTLTRGVTGDTSFNKWATGFIDLVQNNSGLQGPEESSATSIITGALEGGAQAIPSNTGNLATFRYRKRVKIEQINRIGQVAVVYILYEAFPIEYIPASDFDASDDSSISVETLVIAYESFEVKYPGLAGFAANIVTNAIT